MDIAESIFRIIQSFQVRTSAVKGVDAGTNAGTSQQATAEGNFGAGLRFQLGDAAIKVIDPFAEGSQLALELFLQSSDEFLDACFVDSALATGCGGSSRSGGSGRSNVSLVSLGS